MKVFSVLIINIYMKYLIPMFDCTLLGEGEKTLYSSLKYKIQTTENFYIYNGGRIKRIDLKSKQDASEIKLNGKQYYILLNNQETNCFFTSFKYQNKIITISCCKELVVCIEGKIILENKIVDITYSHFEVVDNVCYIYFKGKRNFVVIIKDEKVEFANFYDEYNCQDKEKYFMCKLFDSLNHGKVVHVIEGKIEQYIVYLDDEELNLKSQFVDFVFLDCVKVGNYNYCNNLLNEKIKLSNSEEFKNFFPEFTEFYLLEEHTFALMKKNTLAGIYKFEIENCEICNIILL